MFAQHYLRKHAGGLAKGNLRLAEETMEYLLLYNWPGNVRQRANEMRRLAALAETDSLYARVIAGMRDLRHGVARG